jgi:hypothetical protein
LVSSRNPLTKAPGQDFPARPAHALLDPDGRRSAAAEITDRAPRQALAEHEKARSRDHLKKLIRPVASPYPMLVNIAITAKFYTDRRGYARDNGSDRAA